MTQRDEFDIMFDHPEIPLRQARMIVAFRKWAPRIVVMAIIVAAVLYFHLW